MGRQEFYNVTGGQGLPRQTHRQPVYSETWREGMPRRLHRGSWFERWLFHLWAVAESLPRDAPKKVVRAHMLAVWTDFLMGERKNWPYNAYCRARRVVLNHWFPHLRMVRLSRKRATRTMPNPDQLPLF